MTPTIRAIHSKRPLIPTPHRGLSHYDALNPDGTWECVYLDPTEIEPIPGLRSELHNRASFLNLHDGYRALKGARLYNTDWPIIEVHFDDTGLIVDQTRLHL